MLLFLKVHIPWNVWKTMRFDSELTIQEVIQILAEKQELGEDVKNYGIFIPELKANSDHQGWLNASKRLSDYHLKNLASLHLCK